MLFCMPPKEKAAKPYGVTISFRLQSDKLVKLDVLAEQTGVNRSSLLQLAVDRLLKQGL
jgi:predicted transcriptional regulator